MTKRIAITALIAAGLAVGYFLTSSPFIFVLLFGIAFALSVLVFKVDS